MSLRADSATITDSAITSAAKSKDSFLAKKRSPDQTVPIWPSGAFQERADSLVETVLERSDNPEIQDRAVFGISEPRLMVFRSDKPNGRAVLIFPGGGYKWVVVDKEGYELGDWLSKRGYTVFVLFYRLPHEGWKNSANVSLADAQRAIRTIRARHKEFEISENKVVAMGFSAGGHLCADLATRFEFEAYTRVDQLDDRSARPDLAAPIYPVVSMSLPLAHAGSRTRLLGKSIDARLERRHSPHRNIVANSPPFFLLHSENDSSVIVENSIELHAALRANNIPVEMHLFAEGGHGFGLRKTIGTPLEIWPNLFINWVDMHLTMKT